MTDKVMVCCEQMIKSVKEPCERKFRSCKNCSAKNCTARGRLGIRKYCIFWQS